jgi:hypothetical protein
MIDCCKVCDHETECDKNRRQGCYVLRVYNRNPAEWERNWRRINETDKEPEE